MYKINQEVKLTTNEWLNNENEVKPKGKVKEKTNGSIYLIEMEDGQTREFEEHNLSKIYEVNIEQNFNVTVFCGSNKLWSSAEESLEEAFVSAKYLANVYGLHVSEIQF